MSARHGRFMMLALALGLCATALAQPKSETPVKPNKFRPSEMTPITPEIVQKLAGEDADARKQATEVVKSWIEAMPNRALEPRLMIFKTLIAAKRYDDALELGWHGIVKHSDDAKVLEQFQVNRVRVLLAAGKTEEALSNAKSLFNVASMSGTSEAILLVAESINAARPKDKDMFNKFREEQMAGANLPSTAPASATPAAIAGMKGPRCAVLESIKVDAKPYEQLLAGVTGEDYESLMKRGNLLLMGDKIKEAKEIFERMYSLASNAELVEASEALARSMRAEDGTIARANAWVGAIRPKPAGGSAPK